VRFRLGIICATPRALDLLARSGISAVSLLARHQAGDWGDVPPEDALKNERSVAHGFRVLSSYQVGTGRVWLITEWDRNVTTMLLPEEY
jgi:hypothetical protein